MKYIIFTLFALFYIPTVIAVGSIEIATDKNSYDIEDTINLTIDINSDNQTPGEIQISNLDNNFQIVSRSQSNSTQIINGVAENRIYFSLGLAAYESGDYIIGPVVLTYQDGEEIISESIQISVTGERITIDSNLNPPNSSHLSSNSGSTPQDLSKIDLGNKTKSGAKKQILGIDGEIMEDIYDIKPNKYPSLFSFLAIIGAGLFTALIYIIQNLKPENISGDNTKKYKKTDYNKLLKSVKKQYLDSPKDIFYGKIGEIFRIYLDENIDKNISHKTLSQAKKTLPKNLHNMYTAIYFPAYDNSTDSVEQRGKHINLLEQIFKKK